MFGIHIGLVIALPVLLVFWVLIQLSVRAILSWLQGGTLFDDDHVLGVIDEIRKSLFLPGIILIVLGWSIAFAASGWTVSVPDKKHPLCSTRSWCSHPGWRNLQNVFRFLDFPFSPRKDSRAFTSPH